MFELNVTAGIIKSKTDAKGNAPIYIFIYNKSRLVLKESLKYKVPVKLWQNDKKRVHPKAEFASLINSIISKKISDLNIKILKGKIINDTIDINEIINRDKVNEMDFFAFAEGQIKQKNYAIETRRNYRVYLDKIKSFKQHIKLSEINYQFLLNYEAHLRDVLKNEPNTVWGNMKFINTMTNDALKSKYLINDPFKIYNRPKYKQTERTFLNTNELDAIEKFLNTTNDQALLKVASYFLFMAYTGLRFSDAIRFKSSLHIVDNERIVIETQKTKKITNLFINKKIASLIEYIDFNPLEISQTDFNRKLKLIAAFCGIQKKISSHVARHSFGSSLVALGVSEKVAQGLLAHGSASSTKSYYHLQNSSLDEAMKKFN